ncbi:MAG: hypothetical protein QOJ35_3680 [Solirubrobacteraceae bacterium]|nr:hypothetical protein [Solirubrobacteraceae bacterium]
MTRDRLRPAVLARKVLLPPVLAGAAVACLLAALAVTAADGSRARAGNPLSGDVGDLGHRRLVTALSADLEGTPEPRDVRRARRPLPERIRALMRHPYFRLYVRAQRRFDVAWVLVASVDYQETGFERTADEAVHVMAIAAQLRTAHASRGLGADASRAVAARYGPTPAGRVSEAMVIERARAWRLLGTIPAPGRGELATPVAPVAGVVGGCGYFGCPRPGHLHNGVDFLAPAGAPVHAADAGRVALVQTPGESAGYGNFVCLQHRPHLATCYAHLSAVAAKVAVGARMRRGDIVGLVGSTGSSTAPHLHFEVRLGPAACQTCAVDPLPLLSGDVPQRLVPKLLAAARAAVAADRASRDPVAQGDAERAAGPTAPPTPTAPVAPPRSPHEQPPAAAVPTAPARAPSGGAPVRPIPAAPAVPAAGAPEGGASPVVTPGATATTPTSTPPSGAAAPPQAPPVAPPPA